ncbi:MAG TPA: hypothetical protein VF796_11690 [Humisphaera sp.]
MPDRWARLVAASGWPVPASRVALDDLLARYAEPHRAYHDRTHLAECLALLDEARAACADPRAVEVAIWFHDAVYDPRATDNEPASADLADRQLAALGEPAAWVARVHQLILDTAHRDEPASADGALLVDIDLAILGADAARFDAYDRAIRAEYAHVPEPAYRAGRSAVLRRFLDRRPIYRTPPMADRFEAAARRNLAAAIARLGDGPA